MPNKKTRVVTEEECGEIIKTIRNGFAGTKPNERVATIITLECNLGLRVGDVLALKPKSIVKDGDRYHLDIVEQKTGKKRTFTVPDAVHQYITDYVNRHNIAPNERIFPITQRAVQKIIAAAADYLGLDGVSTHSFRKLFATKIYVNNDYDISLVQKILQHSSPTVTARYIGIENKKVEDALKNNVNLFL